MRILTLFLVLISYACVSGSGKGIVWAGEDGQQKLWLVLHEGTEWPQGELQTMLTFEGIPLSGFLGFTTSIGQYDHPFHLHEGVLYVHPPKSLIDKDKVFIKPAPTSESNALTLVAETPERGICHDIRVDYLSSISFIHKSNAHIHGYIVLRLATTDRRSLCWASEKTLTGLAAEPVPSRSDASLSTHLISDDMQSCGDNLQPTHCEVPGSCSSGPSQMPNILDNIKIILAVSVLCILMSGLAISIFPTAPKLLK